MTFGDFGTWPDAASAPAFKAIGDAASNDAALGALGSRVRVPTSDDTKYYAEVRTSADGLSKAIALFNYQNTSQTVTVHLDGQGIASGATTNLVNGLPAPTVSSNSFMMTLPAWGYVFLGARADAACTASLCGATPVPTPTTTGLATGGTTDWAHWGTAGALPAYNNKTRRYPHLQRHGCRGCTDVVLRQHRQDWMVRRNDQRLRSR